MKESFLENKKELARNLFFQQSPSACYKEVSNQDLAKASKSFSSNELLLTQTLNTADLALPIAVAGLTPLTTIDYPELLSCVLFLQGCPWRCTYCQNPQLWSFNKADSNLSSSYLYDFLLKRRGLLEAVVFSGGEATLQQGLLQSMKTIKSLGYKIGLHTGGANPIFLEKLLPYIDWIGMDYKISFPLYEQITQIKNSGLKAFESAKLILNSGLNYEFRTTLDPIIHTEDVLLEGAKILSDLGVHTYALQEFRPEGCENQNLLNNNFTQNILFKSEKILQIDSLFRKFIIRSS